MAFLNNTLIISLRFVHKIFTKSEKVTITHVEKLLHPMITLDHDKGSPAGPLKDQKKDQEDSIKNEKENSQYIISSCYDIIPGSMRKRKRQ